MSYDKMLSIMNNISQEIKEKCNLKSDILNGQYMLLFVIGLFANEETEENITPEHMKIIYDIIRNHKGEIQEALKNASEEIENKYGN